MNNRDVIIVSIMTLITVVSWMVFEVIYTTKKSTITAVVAQQIKPINSSFDVKFLQVLKERQNQK